MQIVSPESIISNARAIRYAISHDLKPVDAIISSCFFPKSGPDVYNIAVSGGPDSVAMAALGVAVGLDIKIWHLDHKIRSTSAVEAIAVEEFARALGVDFQLVVQNVTHGPNLEARARMARRSSFPIGIATGHTMDDQAETLIMNLMRGSGMKGLVGMNPGPAKPILSLRRSDTKEICRVLRLTPIHDPSNDTDQFLRNRVRHSLIPELSELVSRDIVPILNRTSKLLGIEDAYLESLSVGIDPTDRVALRSLDLVIRVRVLRRAISEFTGYPPSYKALITLSNYIEGEGNFRFQLAGGLDVVCRRNEIFYKLV